MKDQHEKIKGYRDLSQKEIDQMNAVKLIGVHLDELIDELGKNESIDKRWLSIGKTDLQKGLMAVVRSIAKPTTF